MMTEGVEDRLTVEDILSEASEAKYHTILELWREVLKGSAPEMRKPVSPQWAVRIIDKFPGIGYGDMERFKDAYFDCVNGLLDILLAEIEGDPEALNAGDPEEDARLNTQHYVSVIIAWQKALLVREMAWRSDSPDAAIGVAVLSEVHKMLFGPEALTSLLDQINMEFTDAHSELLLAELEAVRDSEEGR